MADIDDTRKNTNGLRTEPSSQEPESSRLGRVSGNSISVSQFMDPFQIKTPTYNPASKEVWVDENYGVISPGDINGYPVSKKKIYDPLDDDTIWQGDDGGVLPPGHLGAVPVSQEKIWDQAGWRRNANGEMVLHQEDLKGGYAGDINSQEHRGWALNGSGERVYLDIDSMPKAVKEEYRKYGFDLGPILRSAGNGHVQDFNEAEVNLFGLGGKMRTDRFGYTTWGGNADPLSVAKNPSKILDGFSIGVGVGNVITPDGRRLVPEEMQGQSTGGSASVDASGGLLTANYSVPTDPRFYPEFTTGMSTGVNPSASVNVSRMEEAPGWVTRVVRPVLQPKWNGLTEKEAYMLLEVLKRNQHPMLKKR